MIIVTGGAGFIGSNLIEALNRRGQSDILLVDNLHNGRKLLNISDLDIADYLPREAFLAALEADRDFGRECVVLHQGACSDTTEWDGHFIMENNYRYSQTLLAWCLRHRARLIYASSAAVYGAGTTFREQRDCERPINAYAYSKFQFDQYVRRIGGRASTQIVGLRYFNVYGPREQHKGRMASTAYHFHRQISDTGVARLFAGSGGYADGEQRRDFVHVSDVAAVNLWFMDNPQVSGLFNVGTGQAWSFNALAHAVISWHGSGRIDYIPFPEHLSGAYQSFTQADITALRQAGYREPFLDIETGVRAYLDRLDRGRA